jgi:hypothetical protein
MHAVHARGAHGVTRPTHMRCKLHNLVIDSTPCDEIADAENENQIGNRKHLRRRRIG